MTTRAPAKPQIDWDDAPAREVLIDSRARDAFGCLAVLDGRELDPAVVEAAALLATVVGQDLEQTDDGRVPDRPAGRQRIGSISTVDPDARHGHKTAARGFDGYKGHVAVDPDSEIITDTEVSAGNVGDAAVAEQLIDDLLHTDRPAPTRGRRRTRRRTGNDVPETEPETDTGTQPRTVYGDAAYGSGRVPGPARRSRDRLPLQDPAADRCRRDVHQGPASTVDLDEDTVTCPAGDTAPHPPRPGRGRDRLLRRRLHRLPAARPLHQCRRRPHHPGRPLRATPHRRPQRPAAPRLGRRLPSDPAEGGTQVGVSSAPSR